MTICLASTSTCDISNCGPHSSLGPECTCTCQKGYLGTPPYCRPECVLNSHCLSHESCHQGQCIDPCAQACGENSDCKVIRHKPVCSCKHGSKGDPYSKCKVDDHEEKPPDGSICKNGKDCGKFATCSKGNECQCLPNFVGQPPLCQPQCLRNTDCSKDESCISNKCRDPCQGACGFEALCKVIDHVPNCFCRDDYIGNPYEQCSRKPILENEPLKPTDVQDPCSSCGSNTKCDKSNGKCKCILGYVGDPLSGCRPECILNTECAPTKACVNKKCIDPCANTCGLNAKCSVVNHFTICNCEPGYTGDPFKQCSKIITTEPRRFFHQV